MNARPGSYIPGALQFRGSPKLETLRIRIPAFDVGWA
jgi:hypothetical protein